jgi:hypothetical protein
MSDETTKPEDDDVEAHRKLSEDPGQRERKLGEDDDVEAHVHLKGQTEKKYGPTEKKY